MKIFSSNNNGFFSFFKISFKQIHDRLFILITLFLSAVKLLVCSRIDLTMDELGQCAQACNLNLSYVEHPPLLALMNRIFMIFFGYNDVSPRILSTLALFFTAYIVYCFSKRIFNSYTALVTVLLMYSLPMLYTLETVSDILYIMFYILSVYIFYIIISENKIKYLYIFGITVGLGLLSKYQTFLIFPSVLLFLLISKKDRYLFKTKELYFSFIISLLMFIPVIIWNFQNDFATLVYHHNYNFNIRFHIDAVYNSLDVLLQFIGSQIIYYNPILAYLYRNELVDIIFKYVPYIWIYGLFGILLAIFIYYSLVRTYVKTKQPGFLVIIIFSAVILSVCFGMSFYSFQVEYCAKTAVIILCAYISFLCLKSRILKLILAVFIISGVFLSFINPVYFLYGMNFDANRYIKKNMPYIKKTVTAINDIDKNISFIVCTNKIDAHKFNYYTKNCDGKQNVIFLALENNIGLYHRYWNQRLKNLNGLNAVIVNYNTNILSSVKKNNLFEKITPLNENLLLCENFNFNNYKENFSEYHKELEK